MGADAGGRAACVGLRRAKGDKIRRTAPAIRAEVAALNGKWKMADGKLAMSLESMAALPHNELRRPGTKITIISHNSTNLTSKFRKGWVGSETGAPMNRAEHPPSLYSRLRLATTRPVGSARIPSSKEVPTSKLQPGDERDQPFPLTPARQDAKLWTLIRLCDGDCEGLRDGGVDAVAFLDVLEVANARVDQHFGQVAIGASKGDLAVGAVDVLHGRTRLGDGSGGATGFLSGCGSDDELTAAGGSERFARSSEGEGNGFVIGNTDVIAFLDLGEVSDVISGGDSDRISVRPLEGDFAGGRIDGFDGCIDAIGPRQEQARHAGGCIRLRECGCDSECGESAGQCECEFRIHVQIPLGSASLLIRCRSIPVPEKLTMRMEREYCTLELRTAARQAPKSKFQVPKNSVIRIFAMHLCSSILSFVCHLWVWSLTPLRGVGSLLANQQLRMRAVAVVRRRRDFGGGRIVKPGSSTTRQPC